VNSADPAPPVPAGRLSGLRKRVLSALVLLAIALAGLFSGPAAFELLVAVAGAILAWEWTRLVSAGRFGFSGLAVGAVVLASGAVASVGWPGEALAIAAVGAAGVYLFARAGARTRCGWISAGPVYIGIPVVCLIWLRGEDNAGLDAILWLLASVWATDTGAYFAGRTIGGPKLAPRFSPNKTWAGLFGAMVAAAIVGWIGSRLVPAGPGAGALALAGAVLAVVAQGGDLLESAVKRRFGAKDSSALIPGHGGLFDRVDGLLTAAVAFALFQWATDARVLTWP
jgi:phosphatidate cytidylyltransferase